ncbi:MAG: cob(I)yrinic acid a,c-diamide adenosyltransferase [Breznakibacter sp.]
MQRKPNIVLTGDGKGKTTSAMGMIIRAAGHGQKVCLIQFFKSGRYDYGEIAALEKLNIETHQLGAGFTWRTPKEETVTSCINAWKFALEKIFSNQYDLIVLDEVNHLFNLHKTIGETPVAPEEMVTVMRQKPSNLALILTGRYANPLVMDAADTVSEIVCHKHHFNQGVKAAEGIEF